MSALPRRTVSLFGLGALAFASACGSELAESSSSELNAVDYQDVNLEAGRLVMYEAQVRTANACRPDLGSSAQRAACARKVAPPPLYRVEGMTCDIKDELAKVKLGTIDDMLEETADFREGITLKYVKERVGANTMWLMPLFPNNDRWSLPHGCDNLGSPYAVRDYFHASGTLSRACITSGKDEHSATPCWANDGVDRLVQNAHSRGMKILLDVAINHFGHKYLPYDLADVAIDGGDIARRGTFEELWNFDRTYDESLVRPQLLDTPAALDRLAARSGKDRQLLDSLKGRCRDLRGDELVRSFVAYRLALPHERDAFACSGFLEQQAPGFYLGRHVNAARSVSEMFASEWPDVKFLYHQEGVSQQHWEFVRNREYLFRVLNYWVSRGVDGFRFDHATDFYSGMGSNEWKYLVTKLRYYAAKRGQARPIFLAEDFHNQEEMNKVMDIITDGYVGDMAGRGGVTKDSAHVEGVVEKMSRFRDRLFTMTALETHDEKRLTDDTGLSPWTGAGFWGIGATTRSTPMLVMGQEFGSPWQFGFKRSDVLHGRFADSQGSYAGAEPLLGYYRTMIQARLDDKNRALLATNHWNLRTRDGAIDSRIFAMVKWSNDLNVVFVVHNLWDENVAQVFAIPDELGRRIGLDGRASYRFVDALSGEAMGACRTGDDLRRDGLYVAMNRITRAQWLRLESCR